MLSEYLTNHRNQQYAWEQKRRIGATALHALALKRSLEETLSIINELRRIIVVWCEVHSRDHCVLEILLCGLMYLNPTASSFLRNMPSEEGAIAPQDCKDRA